VIKDLIRTAVGKVYDRYFKGVDTEQIELWFKLGGSVKLDDDQSAVSALADLKQIQGLVDKLSSLGVQPFDAPPTVLAAAEFLLEGLVAHRKLSRSEEHAFIAPEQANRKQERPRLDVEFDEWELNERARRGRKGGWN
jgi:magnesium chelatase subunit I